ncbi:MAG: dioxygenase [Anaerolineae bacterium]|nr:dioxygenase [Anaerolineae bacterium]
MRLSSQPPRPRGQQPYPPRRPSPRARPPPPPPHGPRARPTTAPTAPAPAGPADRRAGRRSPRAPSAVTPAQTEGPYYKANPPQAADLLQPGMGGTKLILSGYVFNADCKPVANARVDFWQADANGQYDNTGYTMRGYQVTDANGRYELETVIPGLYPGRTRHIHVKVSAPNGPVLTTQVYFPGEAANARDSIYNARLLADVQPAADGEVGTFNFVLPGR